MTTAQELLKLTDHLAALAVTNRQVVVVTGATGGIGRAIVANLAPDYAVVAQGATRPVWLRWHGWAKKCIRSAAIWLTPRRSPKLSVCYQKLMHYSTLRPSPRAMRSTTPLLPSGQRSCTST